jgi:hypothetical protein
VAGRSVEHPPRGYTKFRPFTIKAGQEWPIFYRAHFFGCRTMEKNQAFGYGYFPARIKLGPVQKGINLPLSTLTVERTSNTKC